MAGQPDFDPDGVWSFCDDQQPGVSIHPLRQADLAALLAHLQHDQEKHQDHILRSGGPAPVVRASVGRPGASAYAQYQRRRAAERPPGPAACPGGWPPWSPPVWPHGW